VTVAGDQVTRHTATISGLNLVSRVTGFVRMLVVAAVLGTTFLGNTYQSANSVPNLVFELFAAGALQAVLVPTLVEALDTKGRAEAERVAGLVLGSLLVVLGGLVVIGAALTPLIARGLFAGAPAAISDDQIRLGTVFLLLFLPQVVFYAAGLVATAALNAEHRFAIPAFAPVLNNIVVTAAYVGFWMLRDGAEPSLDLRGIEIAVLAGGTTLGVVVFTSAPVIALVRSGYALRPKLSLRAPELARFWRQGAWAALFLALTQILLVAVLVLANEVEGGVVAYQLGFTFFLLPHALVAIPVFTALFPGMTRAALAGDDGTYAALVRRGITTITVLGLLATAALIALADPLARLTLFGNGDEGAHQVALATAAFAPGLVPYGLFLLLTRAAYARGEARLPAAVNGVATALGVAAMLVSSQVLDGDQRIAGLAAAHSGAYLIGAIVLAVRLRARLGPDAAIVDGRTLAAGLVAAMAAAAIMAGVGAAVDIDGRLGAAAELASAGAAGAAVYLGAISVSRVGSLRSLLSPGTGHG
jgi:putative peptidoglycan lipid II flippase